MPDFRLIRILIGVLFYLPLTLTIFADVRLPGLFTDHMVLQQQVQINIWGWADDGEKVTVEFKKQKRTAIAKNGRWSIRLSPEKAGGPFVLTVKGKNEIQINDVMIGEVWICSGQSNMEWPLSAAYDAQKDVESATNTMIRLFTVPKLKAKVPVQDVNSKWDVCSPEIAAKFSAVGYYFGRELQRTRKVAIGLINTSWGGSPAEVWMRESFLESKPEYQHDILDAYPGAWRAWQKQMDSYLAEKERLEKNGQKINRNPPYQPWRPAELYNGMIAPLIPYGIKGVIWYQGESNAQRAWQYRRLYPDLIQNWRQDWGLGNFTFIAVQLAPFMKIQPVPTESAWAELREAQYLATKTLPKVGLAVITDLGDENDIHPRKKAPVGERLALIARAIAYGERIEYSGPEFKKMSVAGNKIILEFKHVGRGLVCKGDKLTGFAICGPDKRFVWANAEIQGDKVVVSSPEVTNPVAVRYGWADYPTGNLWNKNGLPAIPFRTDDFPLTTKPKN
jgi:sialate O-acetylesterase